MAKARLPLPVDEVLPRLVEAVAQGSNVVLRSPTATGKTTRVPPALMAALAGQIVMLEPRRIAAQTAARRMAEEQGELVGGSIGYHIRFDRKATSRTRVLVVTEGILLRMLADDPLLEQAGVLVFDEFHERSLSSDLGLAIARRIQREFRPELRIVVMSATLDPCPLADYLEAVVVTSEGGLYPVEMLYRRPSALRPGAREIAAAVEQVLDAGSGDVLVFLPGVGEIRRVRNALTGVAAQRDLLVCELYGELPIDRQETALRRADRRRIVLATNVAETSVTVEGVTAVIDTGLARVARSDPSVGLNRLAIERISRESADQRAGRAGRTAPGICVRLWSEQDHRHLRVQQAPEIARLDLSGALLTLVHWGAGEVRRFPWYEPPPDTALQRAEAVLAYLGAVVDGKITDSGKQLARLPVHPRLGRLLVEGHRLGCGSRAALAAALLSERDPFVRESRTAPSFVSPSDLLDRIQAIEDFSRGRETASGTARLHPDATRHIVRVQQQLLRSMSDCGWEKPSAVGVDDAALCRAVLAAFADRVARRREPGSPRARMVGGQGVRLAHESAVREAELFVCVEVEDVGGADAIVRQASLVKREWLDPRRVHETEHVEFDADRERVLSFRRLQYEDLVLEERPVEAADSQSIARVLADAACRALDRVISLQDPDVAQFLARVRSLRHWMPQWGLPEFNEEELRAILPGFCAGRRSFAELRAEPWGDHLRSTLTGVQRAALDREAPMFLVAPSGSRIRLHYEPGRPPVMAVRIQEMFGCVETPRVAGGRVTVLLHLLAPNLRPQQITDDLPGFWERTYPVVRKELRRRYPKHAWPDDPSRAAPERRPQRKK